ncbi:MAG: DUF3794 domain-containing protein [Clostridiales bacterium]|jgi:hypothetical protein|nr:DUF3794 domain-containing protein [Clostridiales bacterium]
MADELRFGEIKTQYKKFVAESQVTADFAVEDKDGKGIKKILSVVVEPKVASVDALSGEAVVNGRINYKLLYVNEDGEPVGADYFSDYKDSVFSTDIAPSSALSVNTTVVDMTVNESDAVSVSVVLENKVYMVIQEDIPALTGIPEGYFDERRKVITQSYGESLRSVVEVSDESLTGGVVGRILTYEVAAVINDARVNGGVISEEGTLYANVLYTTADGEYVNKQFTVPFSEEQAVAPGLDLAVFAAASVKGAKVVLAGSEDNNIIRIEASVEVSASVIVNTEEEVISDVFSVTRELETQREKYAVPRYFTASTFTETVGDSVALDEESTAVNEVLGYLGAANNIASMISSNDRATVEGVFSVTVLYRGADEEIYSVNVEIPYSIGIKDNKLTGGLTLEGNGAVAAVNIRRKRDRELDITAELFFNVRAYGGETITVVSFVTEIGEKEDTLSAISVYNTSEGETLWDMAKALSCTPEMIISQNEELVLPVKTPGRVILYRALE